MRPLTKKRLKQLTAQERLKQLAAQERKRRSRERQARGEESLMIEVEMELVEQALRIRDGLSEAAELPRRVVAREVGEVIAIWAERWVRTRHE